MKRANLINQRFSRLTVISLCYIRKERNGSKAMWHCLCSCGSHTIVGTNDLRTGNSKSCGCYQKDMAKKANTTHGMRNSPEYRIWLAMKNRCTNPNDKAAYKYYGGNGISVCKRWSDSFQAFFDDMGPKPGRKYEIDRIDNSSGYKDDNCRWTTRKEQVRNRSNTLKLTFKGETKSIAEWAEITDFSYHLLRQRKYLKWSDDKILTTPKQR